MSRSKTWTAGEVLSASDLNSEFNNVVNNGEDLGWPATKSKDLDGKSLLLDSDADSHLTADTDDRLDLALAGTDLFRWDGTVATPVNGFDFIAAAAGSEPSITATGSDTDISINLVPKGTGRVTEGGTNLLRNIVEDTTPQLGGQLDVNGQSLGNGTLELLSFSETGSAINEFTIANAAAGNAPQLQATGGDTDIDINLVPKGVGQLRVDGIDLALLLRGQIGGLVLSPDTDTAKDTNITAGIAAAADQSAMLSLTTEITKRLDASWAVGNDQGGLDGTESSAGTPDASTWYYVWLIRRSGTGVVDVLYSESATSPTMPTNYDQRRRIGAVRTDGSANILQYSSVETDGGSTLTLWDDPPLDTDVTDQGVSALTRTLSTPSTSRMRAECNMHIGHSTTSEVYARSPDQNDEAPSNTVGPLETLRMSTSGTGQSNRVELLTGTSSDITTRASATSTTIRIATLGWVDFRRD